MLSRYDEARKTLDAARAAVIINAQRMRRECLEREEQYHKEHCEKIQQQVDSMWW